MDIVHQLQDAGIEYLFTYVIPGPSATSSCWSERRLNACRDPTGEALPNICFVTGFTCEAGPEVIGGLHRQNEAMKSWLHVAYTSI